MRFPQELLTGIWHTTSIERFNKILETGYILAEPDISDESRWGNSSGSMHYPYVRKLGGISLFDFRYFSPSKYSRQFSLSSWRYFVPVIEKWGTSIWIEIDYESLGNNFIPGNCLVKQWEHEKAWKHTIMPHIEAASMIPISTNLFKRVMISTSEYKKLKLYNF
ncbi:hypothetical protein RMB03_01050 [Acinetobacter sp. V91_7]|uniref:hypothetical protein n=1 Tax=unclassified Acinetobacter TaxID=196816 RepID=UPI00287C9D11|nr:MULTISPECIES: hypothetical protein [unclassified Acinetobacter]MDS7932153.1 hypothetical protein [Acinetobacter sp. V91_4B]MDS7961551.1 hypothetical protein [Acinetobacter sp. V91_7]MDS8028001.1 hypothetical protein [Acinetobacter sp. V91_13]